MKLFGLYFSTSRAHNETLEYVQRVNKLNRDYGKLVNDLSEKIENLETRILAYRKKINLLNTSFKAVSLSRDKWKSQVR